MTTSKIETSLDWIFNGLGLAGGIPAIAEKIGKIWGHIPEDTRKQIQQKMPGFMGLSLADERIFNALTGKLSIEKQKLLTDFLEGRCKDFQRNRFINIVAGMEVVQGSPEITERILGKDGKATKETVTAAKAGEDLRLNFLKKFTAYIKKHGVDEAYKDCIGGRMILENPFHQKAINQWKESVEWFEKTFLTLFGVTTLKELRDNLSTGIGNVATTLNAKAASLPKHNGHLRGIFGDRVGNLLEKIFIS